jgi:S1-C subfamily serine protease
MAETELERSHIEGDDGPPPKARTVMPIAPPSPRNARRSHRLRNSALVGSAVVALAAGLGLASVASKGSPSVSASSASMSSASRFGSNSLGTSASTSLMATRSGPTDVSSIADKVDPGLVDINTLLGFQEEEAAGTGIVLSSSGEVLTNNHVINGATAIYVRDIANGKTYSATVVGYDITNDVAVLQLHDASGLQTASIGNSSNVFVREPVVGVGNAGGTGATPSAAGGIVTGLNQSITATDQGNGSSEQLTDLIETNAAIQPGDSGGSLVNSLGQVIAIDTAGSAGLSIQSGRESAGNRGYAIPINEATSIAKEIESGTSSSTIHIGSTGFLGIQIESNAQADGGSITGAKVAGVITGSTAQVAGLAVGDVITSVNGQTVASADALTELLEPFHPGDQVTIGWTNSLGQTETASVQPSSGPPR